MVVGALVALASAQPASAAIQAVEPVDGAPLRLDDQTTFAVSGSCSGGGLGPALLFSEDSAVGANGGFISHNGQVATQTSQQGGVTYFTYDPTTIRWADLPEDGSILYWQGACGSPGPGGIALTEGTAPRALQVTRGTRYAPPGDDEIGGSVESGEIYVNDPKVDVAIAAPEFATDVRVANDGGFGGSKTFEVQPDYRFRIPWKLATSGPERLPKTVYIRFIGADPPFLFEGGISPTQTFTDDIVLDETNPTISSAELEEGGAARMLRGGSTTLVVRASDKTSGVEEMQVSSKKGKGGKWVRFRKRVRIKGGSKKLHVRVRDAAGNQSRWTKVS
jgi:hypothetical protein